MQLPPPTPMTSHDSPQIQQQFQYQSRNDSFTNPQVLGSLKELDRYASTEI